ncbi:cystatin-like protein [Astyanax mexicanus]|uniref:Cystatin-like protein n=1 Tax=Astyanax mexicanus TaxID=7994 RepID=A0A8T2LQY9_ASTMX|nr:cystatin-like protein [Astyanax mexicanus]
MCPVAKSESEYMQGQNCELIEAKARWFDCVVCKKREGGEYVDCALYKDKAKRIKMKDECDTYFRGGKTAMLQSPGHDDQKFGCVGCV